MSKPFQCVIISGNICSVRSSGASYFFIKREVGGEGGGGGRGQWDYLYKAVHTGTRAIISCDLHEKHINNIMTSQECAVSKCVKHRRHKERQKYNRYPRNAR